MASVGHVIVGLAAGRFAAGKAASPRARTTWMIGLAAASLLPDADVVSFALGIPYGAPFGHRGASHALVTALAVGVIAGCVVFALARSDRRTLAIRVAVFTALVVATHGPLDAMTDGGLGVALLWPFSNERIFFGWRPIPVAPIGGGLLSEQGLDVMAFEVVAFAPLIVYALLPRFWRSRQER